MAVALAVPRQEDHRQAGDLPDAQRPGRLAPRALDRFRAYFFQVRKIVNARTADNAEHRLGHEKCFSSGGKNRQCQPGCTFAGPTEKNQ